jgi:hypothetical protein
METQNPATITFKDNHSRVLPGLLWYWSREIHLNGLVFVLLLVILITGQYAKADPNSFTSNVYATPAIKYRLVEGSTLTDNWQGAGRPTIQVPIRGYFWLKHLQNDPLFSNYSVQKMTFQSMDLSLLSYSGSLNGTYRVGGEVALLQQMVLKGVINDSQTILLDSGLQIIDINFPWIEIDVKQVFPDSLRVFDLHLVAVPWPKIWFSTTKSFKTTTGANVSDGDIISTSGNIIRRNNQLTGKLGIMPIVPDLGLDAIMLEKLPNAQPLSRSREIYFSIPRDIFSETLGLLHNGDLLSDNGSIVKSYTDFIKPFGPMPPVADYGLDAIAVSTGGELLFSIEKNFFSERLGKTISNGDLLSEKGYICRTNSDLLSKFKLYPTYAAIDIGLDAVYLRPGGEIWFSTKSSFPVEKYGNIGPGDLLSSFGKVVARNYELLDAFMPVGNTADFGLDALEILWPNLEADLNEDGVVDLTDYAIFMQTWISSSTDNNNNDEGTIIDGNLIDMPDMADFFEDWPKQAEAP